VPHGAPEIPARHDTDCGHHAATPAVSPVVRLDAEEQAADDTASSKAS